MGEKRPLSLTLPSLEAGKARWGATVQFVGDSEILQCLKVADSHFLWPAGPQTTEAEPRTVFETQEALQKCARAKMTDGRTISCIQKTQRLGKPPSWGVCRVPPNPNHCYCEEPDKGRADTWWWTICPPKTYQCNSYSVNMLPTKVYGHNVQILVPLERSFRLSFNLPTPEMVGLMRSEKPLLQFCAQVQISPTKWYEKTEVIQTQK